MNVLDIIIAWSILGFVPFYYFASSPWKYSKGQGAFLLAISGPLVWLVILFILFWGFLRSIK